MYLWDEDETTNEAKPWTYPTTEHAPLSKADLKKIALQTHLMKSAIGEFKLFSPSPVSSTSSPRHQPLLLL